MTKAGFGEHLKREREMRAVSLNEICSATRISVRFLEALEAEEWDKLPGGVFNRGFVRAVARFLGLDEEGCVAEYEMATQEHGPAQPANPIAHSSAHPLAHSQPKVPWLAWASVAGVLALAGIGWLGWHWYASHRAQRSSSSGADSGAAVSPHAASSASVPSDGSATPSAAAPSDKTAQDAANPNGSLQLKVEAGKATALTVTADGQPTFSGRIIAGQTRTFAAQNNFEVSAQDAGALLLQLNGKTLAPIGPPGRPGTVTLTQRDVSAAPGGAN